jgi:kynurenine formamidase
MQVKGWRRCSTLRPALREHVGRLPAHFAAITREYCQIEKLANLDLVPRPFGFRVSCFPVKIECASTGWCRAVAIVD